MPMCPIHSLWEAVSAHTPPGQPLFPSLIRSNINRILKATFPKAGIRPWGRYSAHFGRRGAANEILRSAPSLATIMRTGGWQSGGYKAYLDLREAEEADIRNISRRPGGGDSSYTASYNSSASDAGISANYLRSLITPSRFPPLHWVYPVSPIPQWVMPDLTTHFRPNRETRSKSEKLLASGFAKYNPRCGSQGIPNVSL